MNVYYYESVFYCEDCADYDASDPEWLAYDSTLVDGWNLGSCCGTCGHNLACALKVPGQVWEDCPGCAEAAADPGCGRDHR